MFQGDEYVFYEDWGEQLVDKSCPVVCVLDVEAGIVSTLDNLPDNISPGQVKGWSHGVIVTGIYLSQKFSCMGFNVSGMVR